MGNSMKQKGEMKMRKTQKSEILQYLKDHKEEGLTQIQATEYFGATRLSGIIYDLRNRDGYNIITTEKVVKNRYGGTSVVGVYRLEA